MFERILVPLDLSEEADKVLSPIGRLMRRPGTEVILYHALQSASLHYPVLPGAPVTVPSAEFHKQAALQLEKLAERLKQADIQARWSVQLSAAASGILDQAGKCKADLVAMTTHGRSGLSRWVLGSTTEKVLRAGTVPTILVRSGKHAPKSAEFPRLLIPVDGSDCSNAIAVPAREFALIHGCRVTLLFVEEENVKPSCDPFTAVAERLESDRVPYDVKRERGNPVQQILEASKSASAIAMATHGRSGFSRLFLGSVTEKVMRSTEVPMLVVPAGE